MDKDKAKRQEKNDLRARAEEVLKKMKPKDLDKSVSVAVKELIQELQIRQIELEMQDEELRSDITERKKAEEDIANQVNLFKNIVSNIPYPIAWKDRNSVYLGCNKYFAKAAGVGKPEDIFGKTDYDLPWDKGEAELFIADDKQVIDSGVPITELETERQGATLLTSNIPLRDFGGNVIGVLGIKHDISGLKKTERELKATYEELKIAQADLAQSEKMAAIGRLSAGIAHDVKNPLAIIVSCAELMENQVSHCDKEAMDTLGKIKGAALRANSVLVSLLQFARPIELKVEIVYPHELIDSVLPLLEKQAYLANITITRPLSDDTIRLLVDRNHLHLSLFNVVKNAIEAMPIGGALIIKTYRSIEPELSPSKASCVMEIKDTGCGISKENIAKISEPFFSTKERGSGTGLGLFMVKAILKKHNGKLLVESEEGKGTAVKIILPIVDDEK